jgi:uncharacterized protein (DUF1800 family)
MLSRAGFCKREFGESAGETGGADPPKTRDAGAKPNPIRIVTFGMHSNALSRFDITTWINLVSSSTIRRQSAPPDQKAVPVDLQPIHAMVRFGLGRAANEPLPPDPAAWLLNQLRQPDAPWSGPTPSTRSAMLVEREQRERREARKEAAAGAPQVNTPGETAARVTPVNPGKGDNPGRARFLEDSRAAMARAVATTTPFRERLVWFWSNHFTISVRRPIIAPLAGAFVEEAIRPHVTGRFQDMLFAVMRHPAMIQYLDNQASIGPNSRAGQRREKGLNENLARECLELHTVTPASGYTQADVTAFARILTGWSLDFRGDTPGFLFRPNVHEPGAQTMMGRTFPDGEEGGVAALSFLAAPPSTYRHLATRLVTHFVADQPPPAAVSAIEAILRDTRGDLGAATAGLVRLPDAWTPLTKYRTPRDLVVATFRAIGPVEPAPPYPLILNGLGQPIWGAPAPNGWSDQAADWTSPEAMMRRIDWAFGVAHRPIAREPLAIADDTLGPLLTQETRQAVARAGDRREALTLLLTSPEFQRR